MNKKQRSDFMTAFNEGAALACFKDVDGTEVNDLSGVYEGEDLIRIWEDSVIMMVFGDEESNTHDNEVYLEAILSTQPNTGRGGAALDWLTGLADKFGISIRLVSDVDGMFVNEYLSELGLQDEKIPQKVLDSLYEKKGFSKTGKSSEMLRPPLTNTL